MVFARHGLTPGRERGLKPATTSPGKRLGMLVVAGFSPALAARATESDLHDIGFGAVIIAQPGI
jgi:hypothetical protein